MRIAGTGVFGSRYNPRVIWFGIANNDQLKSLGNKVLDLLDEAGFEKDRQNFVPHLTVGRIKEVFNKENFQNTIENYKNAFLQQLKVTDVHLYESLLRPEGPAYILVEKYKLGTKST